MAKKNYYAVASGKRTGIFDSWDEARPLVERVRGALHKGFATRDEAEKWLAEQSGGRGAEPAPGDAAPGAPPPRPRLGKTKVGRPAGNRDVAADLAAAMPEALARQRRDVARSAPSPAAGERRDFGLNLPATASRDAYRNAVGAFPGMAAHRRPAAPPVAGAPPLRRRDGPSVGDLLEGPPKKKARADTAPAPYRPRLTSAGIIPAENGETYLYGVPLGPPRGITGNSEKFDRLPARDQEVCRARDDFDANDGEYFPNLTGTLTDWENEIYLYLLKQYGQPLTGNFYAVREFKREFGYRKWESVRTHVNRFNGGQTTHKTGPRGGKIKSTVYKDWVAAHGGEWVGFQWRPL
ncbi:unnamed protein product [Pelagomonas calceolata]|uniref:Ribonuclease H1 N-terminal domain-containing protein n=1 Tax=Pelagomonas calceolata TaxID=35677 RepID=A0A8J2SJZ9_9STRA|nr:unnamed protein product [Pelagomonas calceolata]